MNELKYLLKHIDSLNCEILEKFILACNLLVTSTDEHCNFTIVSESPLSIEFNYTFKEGDLTIKRCKAKLDILNAQYELDQSGLLSINIIHSKVLELITNTLIRILKNRVVSNVHSRHL